MAERVRLPWSLVLSDASESHCSLALLKAHLRHQTVEHSSLGHRVGQRLQAATKDAGRAGKAQYMRQVCTGLLKAGQGPTRHSHLCFLKSSEPSQSEAAHL